LRVLDLGLREGLKVSFLDWMKGKTRIAVE